MMAPNGPALYRLPQEGRLIPGTGVIEGASPVALHTGTIQVSSAFGWAIALYAFLLGLLEPTQWWYIPNGWIAIVGVASAAWWLYAGRFPFPFSAPGVKFVLSLLVWLLVTAVYSDYPENSLATTRYIASVYVVGILVLCHLQRLSLAKLWLAAYVAGVCLLAIGTLTVEYGSAVSASRAVGLARQENILGQAMGSGVSAAVLLYPFCSRVARMGLAAYILLCIVALLISGSRGSGLAVAAVFVVLVVKELLPRLRRHWISILIVVGASAMLLPLIGEALRRSPLVARFEGMTGGVAAFTQDERWSLYTHAWDIFLSSPVIGIGMGNYGHFHPLYTYTHTAFLELLIGAGLIGALLYYGYLGELAISCFAASRLNYVPLVYRQFFNAAVAVLAGAVVQGAFSLSHQSKHYTVLVFTIIGVAVMIDRYRRGHAMVVQ